VYSLDIGLIFFSTTRSNGALEWFFFEMVKWLSLANFRTIQGGIVLMGRTGW